MHHAHLQCENTQIELHIDTHICLSQSFPLINHLQRPSYTHTNTHPRKRHTHTDIFSLWYTYIKYAHARFPPSFMCACGHVCCHVFVQFGVCVCVCVSQPAGGMCWQCVCNSRVSGLKSQSGWIKAYFTLRCSALLTFNTHLYFSLLLFHTHIYVPPVQVCVRITLFCNFIFSRVF